MRTCKIIIFSSKPNWWINQGCEYKTKHQLLINNFFLSRFQSFSLRRTFCFLNSIVNRSVSWKEKSNETIRSQSLLAEFASNLLCLFRQNFDSARYEKTDRKVASKADTFSLRNNPSSLKSHQNITAMSNYWGIEGNWRNELFLFGLFECK